MTDLRILENFDQIIWNLSFYNTSNQPEEIEEINKRKTILIKQFENKEIIWDPLYEININHNNELEDMQVHSKELNKIVKSICNSWLHNFFPNWNVLIKHPMELNIYLFDDIRDYETKMNELGDYSNNYSSIRKIKRDDKIVITLYIISTINDLCQNDFDLLIQKISEAFNVFLVNKDRMPPCLILGINSFMQNFNNNIRKQMKYPNFSEALDEMKSTGLDMPANIINILNHHQQRLFGGFLVAFLQEKYFGLLSDLIESGLENKWQETYREFYKFINSNEIKNDFKLWMEDEKLVNVFLPVHEILKFKDYDIYIKSKNEIPADKLVNIKRDISNLFETLNPNNIQLYSKTFDKQKININYFDLKDDFKAHLKRMNISQKEVVHSIFRLNTDLDIYLVLNNKNDRIINEINRCLFNIIAYWMMDFAHIAVSKLVTGTKKLKFPNEKLEVNLKYNKDVNDKIIERAKETITECIAHLKSLLGNDYLQNIVYNPINVFLFQSENDYQTYMRKCKLTSLDNRGVIEFGFIKSINIFLYQPDWKNTNLIRKFVQALLINNSIKDGNRIPSAIQTGICQYIIDQINVNLHYDNISSNLAVLHNLEFTKLSNILDFQDDTGFRYNMELKYVFNFLLTQTTALTQFLKQISNENEDNLVAALKTNLQALDVTFQIWIQKQVEIIKQIHSNS